MTSTYAINDATTLRKPIEEQARSGVFARGAQSTGWGLVVLDAALERRVVPLQDGAVIGSSSSSALLEGAGVAPQHARIVVREDGVYVEDLAPEGGTWVQGVRVRRAQLAPRDLLRLGEVLTMFVERGLDEHRGSVLVRGELVHGPAQREWFLPLLEKATRGESICIEGPPDAGKRALATFVASLREEEGGVVVVQPGVDFYAQGARTWLVLDADQLERSKQHHVAAQARQRRDACVIATISRPLEQAVRDGVITPSFRALFASKAVVVRSFDDRAEDLPVIAAQMADRVQLDPTRMGAALLERIALMGCAAGLSRLEALLRELSGHEGPLEIAPALAALPRRPSRKLLPLSSLDDDLLRARLLDALSRADGSVAVAARALGVTRQNVYREGRRLSLPLTARILRPS